MTINFYDAHIVCLMAGYVPLWHTQYCLLCILKGCDFHLCNDIDRVTIV